MMMAFKDCFKNVAVNTIDDFKLQDRLLRQDLNQILGGNAKTTLISINRYCYLLDHQVVLFEMQQINSLYLEERQLECLKTVTTSNN